MNADQVELWMRETLNDSGVDRGPGCQRIDIYGVELFSNGLKCVFLLFLFFSFLNMLILPSRLTFVLCYFSML